MGESKSSLKSNLHVLNRQFKAQRNPFTACSGRTFKSGQSLTSASGDSSTAKSWKSFYSTLLRHSSQNRKLAEQGLVTPKSRGSLERRQIRDKSYYKGIIYRKGYEISSEMKKLLKEIDMMMADQSTYISYKVKAQAQASELDDLQASFADYNLAIEFSNTEIEARQVQEECGRLKENNQKEIVELEKLFELRKQKEVLVAELETEIDNEGYASDVLSSITDLEICERYQSLKKLDENLKLKYMKLNEELKMVNSEINSLEKRCAELNRSEASALISKLNDDKSRRDFLREEQKFQDVSTEDECLSLKIEKDNEVVRCLLRETRAAQTEVEKLKCNFKMDNKDLELENRASKLATLRDRSSAIDSFLNYFPQKQSVFLEKRSELQVTIIRLLEKMSGQLMVGCTTNPDIARRFSMEKEEDNRKLSLEMKDLLEKKILEEKMLEEDLNLKLSIAKKNEDMLFYSDVDKLKKGMEEKLEKLLDEARTLQKQTTTFRTIVRDLKIYRDSLIEKLNKSDFFPELSNMEKRWRLLEQENFSIQEQLAETKTQGDYSSVKSRVMKNLHELNDYFL